MVGHGLYVTVAFSPVPARCLSLNLNVIPHWCAGAILNGSDPSQILQRGSELLFPITTWEKRTGAANQWEWRGCMIGDASGLMPLKAQGTTDEDSFLLWYGGGDSLSGAAVVTVKRLH
jgi:hypothetical protein